MVPGAGSGNPDGWYDVLMYTPLSKDIRAEGDQSLSIEVLMPALANQPGPGDAGASLRDLKVGVDLIDTYSTSQFRELEEGNFTIDRRSTRSTWCSTKPRTEPLQKCSIRAAQRTAIFLCAPHAAMPT